MLERGDIPSSTINRKKQGKREREGGAGVGRQWCNLYQNTIVGRKRGQVT